MYSTLVVRCSNVIRQNRSTVPDQDSLVTDCDSVCQTVCLCCVVDAAAVAARARGPRRRRRGGYARRRVAHAVAPRALAVARHVLVPVFWYFYSKLRHESSFVDGMTSPEIPDTGSRQSTTSPAAAGGRRAGPLGPSRSPRHLLILKNFLISPRWLACKRPLAAMSRLPLALRPLGAGATLFLAPSLWGRGSSDDGS